MRGKGWSPRTVSHFGSIAFLALWGAVACSGADSDELKGPSATSEPLAVTPADDRSAVDGQLLSRIDSDDSSSPAAERSTADQSTSPPPQSAGNEDEPSSDRPSDAEQGATTSTPPTSAPSPDPDPDHAIPSGAERAAISVGEAALARWPQPTNGTSAFYSDEVRLVPFGLAGPAAFDEMTRLDRYLGALGAQIESPRCVVSQFSGSASPDGEAWYLECEGQYSDDISAAFGAPPQPIIVEFAVIDGQIATVADLVEPTFGYESRFHQYLIGPGADQLAQGCGHDLLDEKCAAARVVLAQAAAQS